MLAIFRVATPLCKMNLLESNHSQPMQNPLKCLDTPIDCTVHVTMHGAFRVENHKGSTFVLLQLKIFILIFVIDIVKVCDIAFR